jgi:hypothetical protein
MVKNLGNNKHFSSIETLRGMAVFRMSISRITQGRIAEELLSIECDYAE